MSDEKVVLIETNKILVVNPRKRDEFTHKEIKENIRLSLFEESFTMNMNML